MNKIQADKVILSGADKAWLKKERWLDSLFLAGLKCG